MSRAIVLIWATLLLSGAARGIAAGEERDYTVVELTGRAEEFFFKREWRSYYWREDFAFLLREEGTEKVWRIISREPTPFCGWRCGTTYTGLKVDWTNRPKVKLVGVRAVDRTPAEFHGWKLDEQDTVTAFVVQVDADGNGEMKDWYINNWLHHWGEKANAAVVKIYIDRDKPYDVYGWVGGFDVPFDKEGQALVEKHKPCGKMIYHGAIRTTQDNPKGCEIRLIHLFARNARTGGYDCVLGDVKSMIPLDGNAPPEAKQK
jgi:hypothetical protein